jgi:hypothetical protein
MGRKGALTDYYYYYYYKHKSKAVAEKEYKTYMFMAKV